ncbi:MAG: sigma-54-dependent transcriptional regulator [Planctomycetota bacterium]
MPLNVLLVEDERSIAVTLGDSLAGAGHKVKTVADGAEALTLLEKESFDCVVTDVRLPGAGGMEVLRKARALADPPEVVVMTAYATIEHAVEAMRAGASDYLQKPFVNEAVVEKLARLEKVRAIGRENVRLASELGKRPAFGEIVGQSPLMRELFQTISRVAPSDAAVLIEGESGTGKERVARAIHKASGRGSGPFVPFSCAALPDTMIEDELFGHEKGAFTDAHREKRGRFEIANGGTMFLDDVDDAPAATQVKLLRVLQEKTFERVGGEKPIKVDVRVVSATKVQLRKRIAEKRFREDLFWRLNVVPITLPPLRARTGDLPLLVDHFLGLYAKDRRHRVRPEDMEAMERYPWPGNVRELENSIQRAVALAGDAENLRREHLLPISGEWRGAFEVHEEIRPLRAVLEGTEREHLKRVLEKTGGHRAQAAKLLGISRKVLWEKLRNHGLEAEKSPGAAEEEEGAPGEEAEA